MVHLPQALDGMMLWGESYELLRPSALALLTFLPLLLWPLLSSLADLSRTQRALLLLARCVLLSLLTLAIARPVRIHDATRISAVFLVDVSDSIVDAGLSQARELLKEAFQKREKHDVQLITFAARPKRVALAEDKSAPRIARHTDGAHTDLAAALRLAYGLFPQGHIKRALILSDGLQTKGDLLAEAARAKRLGVTIQYRAQDQGRPEEVAVQALLLPPQLSVGETFELRAQVFASQATSARLKLFQDQILNGLSAIQDVDLQAGDNEIRFKSVVRSAGQVTYRLELQPSSADRFASNNSVEAAAIVPGRARVLVVESVPSHVSPFARALGLQDFDVEIRSAMAFPTSLSEIARYDFVILSDVPAERLSRDQLSVIERYVRDAGGGFMMAGGDQSFGLGGYQDTRMEDLLPVTMDSERRRDEHSVALAIVLDCSGSMSGQKIELAKDAANASAQLLGQDDSLAVIGFSGEPERVVRMQSASNRLRITQSIGRLTAQGGTAIFPALDMAFQDLLAVTARIKHVILLTDGQTQERGIPDLVQAMRAEGITLSTVGMGVDVNRSLLQEAANLGAGRAYLTADPSNVPRIFVRETITIGQNSAIEEQVRMLPGAPADFLKGIDLADAPLLRGYVATQAKSAPAQMVLQSEQREPLLARWRVGLGWVLAWTSDLTPRWSADLLRWHAFPTFFGQLVREHIREQRSDELPMRAELRGDEAYVVLDAIGKDDRFQNDLESRVTLHGPASGRGTLPPQEKALVQQAPGRYEARFALDGYGPFTLHALHRREGKAVAQSHAQLSRPYPAEYSAHPPDRTLLEQSAALTGGADLASIEQLFDPAGRHVQAHEELWPIVTFLALVIFLVDLLLRRIRI